MFADFFLEKMKAFGGQTAMITDGKEYTYNDLIAEYDAALSALNAAGVPDNSIVALLGEFTAQNVGFMLAIINKGCIYVPIATAVKDKRLYMDIAEVQYCVESGLVTRTENIAPRHEILKKLVSDKNPGIIFFSSGTTGQPKAAVHNLVPMLEKYRKDGKALRSMAFLLFDHIGGFNTVMHNIANGGLLVTLKNRSADEVASNIEKHKLELLPTSPSFINIMLFSEIYKKYDLSSLKIISYGTEPMPEATLKKIHEILPNARLKQTYGLSEVGIMRTKSEADDSLWLKVGGDETHQTKIVDGILFIKSKMSMLGYLNAPSPFDGDGWMNTKDRVEQKGDYIRILGRESEMINVGGEKVFPQEVESVLLEVEGVKDAVVQKEAHPMLGNIVTCRIAVDEGADTAALKKAVQRHCSERLEKFKRPVKISFETTAFNTERFKRKR